MVKKVPAFGVMFVSVFVFGIRCLERSQRNIHTISQQPMVIVIVLDDHRDNMRGRLHFFCHFS